jgi:adenine/guanine phosphoribosyltransferase-like PRPP-binding protein
LLEEIKFEMPTESLRPSKVDSRRVLIVDDCLETSERLKAGLLLRFAIEE